MVGVWVGYWCPSMCFGVDGGLSGVPALVSRVGDWLVVVGAGVDMSGRLTVVDAVAVGSVLSAESMLGCFRRCC